MDFRQSYLTTNALLIFVNLFVSISGEARLIACCAAFRLPNPISDLAKQSIWQEFTLH